MKLNRQRKTKVPCQGCSLHMERCICEFIPSLDLKTKITLVVHAKELKRTTNTGTLALKALSNSETLIRGKSVLPLDLTSCLRPDYQSFLYYPAENALELTPELVSSSPLPVQLIVPDGSWRQASKVHYRHPELASIPRVMISRPNEEEYHLRKENTDYGRSTLEAIALALGILEGMEVQNKLLKLYHQKLSQTLLGRGIKTQKVCSTF